MMEIDITRRMCTQQGYRDLSIRVTIARHEFITLSGKSGCGKTTLLRMIAGLAAPDNGSITVDGHCWFDKKQRINLKPQARNTGFVFQEHALFPHMTVKENILYGCKRKGKADSLVSLMELKNMEHRYPDKLSGGQKQRVAIARALASEPQLLLLDEPFSNLDAGIRTKLQHALIKIHELFDITIILVSHDLAEICRLSRRNLVIGDGRIIRDGNPFDLYGARQAGIPDKCHSYIGGVVRLKREGFCGLVAHGNALDEVMFPCTGSLSKVKTGDKVLVSPGRLFSEAEPVADWLN